MARAGHAALVERNINLGGLIKENHEDTMLDEMLSYAFAALGFISQLHIGFKLSFPFNLLLWPFELGEWCVRWLVTSSSTIPK